eukprot:jgi/Chlat1/8283/Chrsp78S07703
MEMTWDMVCLPKGIDNVYMAAFIFPHGGGKVRRKALFGRRKANRIRLREQQQMAAAAKQLQLVGAGQAVEVEEDESRPASDTAVASFLARIGSARSSTDAIDEVPIVNTKQKHLRGKRGKQEAAAADADAPTVPTPRAQRLRKPAAILASEHYVLGKLPGRVAARLIIPPSASSPRSALASNACDSGPVIACKDEAAESSKDSQVSKKYREEDKDVIMQPLAVPKRKRTSEPKRRIDLSPCKALVPSAFSATTAAIKVESNVSNEEAEAAAVLLHGICMLSATTAPVPPPSVPYRHELQDASVAVQPSPAEQQPMISTITMATEVSLPAVQEGSEKLEMQPTETVHSCDPSKLDKQQLPVTVKVEEQSSLELQLASFNIHIHTATQRTTQIVPPNMVPELVPVNSASAVGSPRSGSPLTSPSKQRTPRPKVVGDPKRMKSPLRSPSRSFVQRQEIKLEAKWDWPEAPIEDVQRMHCQVDGFLASMRNVQGDRRFLMWNGSVVDSVVGAFLTQNVSDHLSSSAYMNLAAKYPLRGAPECTIAHRNDDLRHKHQAEDLLRSRIISHADGCDWEAVASAPCDELAACIKGRGMQGILAGRIQAFLNRARSAAGVISLEWMRSADTVDCRAWLERVEGLGSKSIGCVLLLALHRTDFPVDTNINRIACRLGWVPVQSLESFEELSRFPESDAVHRYLWQRLSKLEQQRLYELHYQMITLGKVFCSKQRPNCQACPLSSNCAYANAVARKEACAAFDLDDSTDVSNTVQSAHAMAHTAFSWDASVIDLEELASDRLAHASSSTEAQLLSLLPDLSSPTSASTHNTVGLAMPIRAIGRFRSQVEARQLPEDMQVRLRLPPPDADNSTPYMVVLWPPGTDFDTEEMAGLAAPAAPASEAVEGVDCESDTNINPSSEAVAAERLAAHAAAAAAAEAFQITGHHVLATILVPVRTALRGRFPLNGTYFQINEVFAERLSCVCPVPLPWDARLQNAPLHTVHFGSSVPSIFKGMFLDQVTSAFSKEFVCTRAYDKATGAPRPLPRQLHCSPAAISAARNLAKAHKRKLGLQLDLNLSPEQNASMKQQEQQQVRAQPTARPKLAPSTTPTESERPAKQPAKRLTRIKPLVIAEGQAVDLPERVEVICGDRPGFYLPPVNMFECACSECVLTGSTRWSPCQFEAHGGLRRNKKWRASVRLKETNRPIAYWLEMIGAMCPKRKSAGKCDEQAGHAMQMVHAVEAPLQQLTEARPLDIIQAA